MPNLPHLFNYKKISVLAVIAIGCILLGREVLCWSEDSFVESMDFKLNEMITKEQQTFMGRLDAFEKKHEGLEQEFKRQTDAFNGVFNRVLDGSQKTPSADKKQTFCQAERNTLNQMQFYIFAVANQDLGRDKPDVRLSSLQEDIKLYAESLRTYRTRCR